MEHARVKVVNPVDVEETRSWLAAMAATFLEDPSGPSVDRWTEIMARIWDPARAWGARDSAGRWVATLRTETRTLTVPGVGDRTRDLSVDAVTNVTVSATHRRLGLMSQMLDDALRAAQARGDAVSMLIAAEWSIYGRFGYAPATWSTDYVLYRNRRGGVATGDLARVRGSDLLEIAAVGADVFSAFRRQRPGQVDRDQRWWNISLGQDGFPAPPPGRLPHNWIVHEGGDGVDGIVGWRATRQGGLNPPGGRAEVWGLFAAGDDAYRDLWAYLFGIDLIDEVALSHRPVDEPVRWLMADARSLVLQDRTDFLWLRLLDVPAALAARRYATAGELVLEVRDDAPATGIDVSGRYALRADGETVECAPTDRRADLELTQRALASIYLGGVRPAELVGSGALAGLTAGALERTRLMFSTPQQPWNATSF